MKKYPKKIGPTSPDKVNGNLVKYRQGDCLSIACDSDMYLGALISEKFNVYYDLTLIEYYKTTKPELSDFKNGKFFGTLFESSEGVIYAVDKKMAECKNIDALISVEKIGSLILLPEIQKASYSYFNNIKELQDYYLDELPIRIEKSKNAEKFPALRFASKHLVDVTHILKSAG